MFGLYTDMMEVELEIEDRRRWLRLGLVVMTVKGLLFVGIVALLDALDALAIAECFCVQILDTACDRPAAGR